MPGTQQPYTPCSVEPDWIRFQLTAKQCPRRNTVKHGQRIKPRQNYLGLCGDEGGYLTENTSHFPFDLKIRHFDRIVQFDKLARFEKHRGPAGRDVMHDPRHPSPHVGFYGNDIPAFSLGEIPFLQDVLIPTRVQDLIHLMPHLLFERMSLMGQAPQLRRRRLLDRAVGVDRRNERCFHGSQFIHRLQRVRDGCQRGSVLLMPSHKTATFLQQLQHNRAIPEFADLQRRPFLRSGERVPNIRKCQDRQGLTGCLKLSHLRRFLLAPLGIVEAVRQFEATTTRRPHRRSGVAGKDLEQSGPLQHLLGLFEEVHRYLKKGKRLALESTNSNEPSDRDARHRSADLTTVLSGSGSGGSKTPMIRRGITALVWLDKPQERRYYRPHSGRWIQPAYLFLRDHSL